MADRLSDERIEEIRGVLAVCAEIEPDPETVELTQIARDLLAAYDAEREYGHMGVEDFVFLWQTYAQAPDDTLDEKARELKARLLEITDQTCTVCNLVDQRSHDLIVAQLQAERDEWEQIARLVAGRNTDCPPGTPAEGCQESDGACPACVLNWARAELRKAKEAG